MMPGWRSRLLDFGRVLERVAAHTQSSRALRVMRRRSSCCVDVVVVLCCRSKQTDRTGVVYTRQDVVTAEVAPVNLLPCCGVFVVKMSCRQQPAEV
jgi:hypothetical protein